MISIDTERIALVLNLIAENEGMQDSNIGIFSCNIEYGGGGQDFDRSS